MFIFSLIEEKGFIFFFSYYSYSSLTNLTYKRQTTVTFAYFYSKIKIEFLESQIMAQTRKLIALCFLKNMNTG